MSNTAWDAFEGKATGDPITLVVSGGDGPDTLVEGTVAKMTPATRRYLTADGKEGKVEYRQGWWRARETTAYWWGTDADGRRERWTASVATERDIKRLTDPNREKRERLADALRALRFWREDSKLDELITDIESALVAAKDLRDSL